MSASLTRLTVFFVDDCCESCGRSVFERFPGEGPPVWLPRPAVRSRLQPRDPVGPTAGARTPALSLSLSLSRDQQPAPEVHPCSA
jgi:hypothetical protein